MSVWPYTVLGHHNNLRADSGSRSMWLFPAMLRDSYKPDAFFHTWQPPILQAPFQEIIMNHTVISYFLCHKAEGRNRIKWNPGGCSGVADLPLELDTHLGRQLW